MLYNLIPVIPSPLIILINSINLENIHTILTRAIPKEINTLHMTRTTTVTWPGLKRHLQRRLLLTIPQPLPQLLRLLLAIAQTRQTGLRLESHLE